MRVDMVNLSEPLPAAAAVSPMAEALAGMVGREVFLRLGAAGEVAGDLVWLDTTLHQQRPSPLAQEGQVLVAQSPAEVVVFASAIAAVIAAKPTNGAAGG